MAEFQPSRVVDGKAIWHTALNFVLFYVLYLLADKVTIVNFFGFSAASIFISIGVNYFFDDYLKQGRFVVITKCIFQRFFLAWILSQFGVFLILNWIVPSSYKDSTLPMLGQILIALVVSDFIFVVYHFLAHRFALKRHLIIHHGPQPDTAYTLYQGYASSFFPDQIVLGFAFNATQLLGFSNTASFYVMILGSVAINYGHCNNQLRYGILNYIFTNPESHGKGHHAHVSITRDFENFFPIVSIGLCKILGRLFP